MPKQHNINNHQIGFAWLLLLLFPVSNMFYITTPILFLCLYKSKNFDISNIKLLAVFLILVIALSFLFNVSETYITTKDFQRGLTLIVILFTFTNLRGSCIPKCCIWFAIIYILLSQISSILTLPFISRFFDSIYHINEYYLNSLQLDLSRVDSDSVGYTMRAGGIFYNSNNCASFVSLIYGLGLCEHKQFKKLELLLFAVVCFMSMFYTGSRTSLIVFSVITLIFFYTRGRSLILPLFALGIACAVFSFVDVTDVRMFKVADGMDSSFGVKLGILQYYIYSCDDIIDLMFGAGSTNVLVEKYGQTFGGTDFDLGNILVLYGMLFYVVYIPFNIAIYRKFKREYIAIFPVLLWMLSNSILCSYRMSAVWFLTIGLLLRKSLELPGDESVVRK